MGLHRAGFEVEGWDIKPQKHYPFKFHLGNALESDLTDFDFVWASPPCQRYSATRNIWNTKPESHPDLIAPTRWFLESTGKPWIMENVKGAPLVNPLTLCGTMFGLGIRNAELRRHRLFESSMLMMAPPCSHNGSVIGVYGGHARNRGRETLGIYGHAVRTWQKRRDRGKSDYTKEDAFKAMGIDWMNLNELCQAIPPAYSEFLGRQIIKLL